MLRTLQSVLRRPRTVRFVGLLWVMWFLALFLFIEGSFFVNVIAGDFPFWLLLKILPTIFTEFIFGDISMLLHYTIIAFLLALYVTVLRHMFVTMRYVSLRSLGVSVAGMFGITLGVACISCGALAGLLLVSALGALSLPLTLIHNTSLFLFIGEGLLVLSIMLSLSVLKTFARS